MKQNLASMELSELRELWVLYFRAARCWQSNNLNSCLLICAELTRGLNKLKFTDTGTGLKQEINQLKQLVWFLKTRCLADEYYINESLLLNEEDMEDDDQIRVFSAATARSGAEPIARTATADARGRKMSTSGTSGIMESRPRVGIMTGRMPSVSSRQSSQAASSYRPLTTSLTATQTAFSRSTRPLLKYSTCNLLAKPTFEYLYNAQTVNNKCPDYRQCLEYLNLVQNSIRGQEPKRSVKFDSKKRGEESSILVSPSVELNDKKSLDVFWLVAFGTCYYNLHMNKQAEEFFQQAIALNSKFLDSYTWLVKIYLRTNQPMKVLRTCEDGLRNIKSAILYNWMARVQSLIGDLYGANSNLRESLKFHPTNIEALANVGHFAFYSDKLEQSLRCFERILQLSANQSTTVEGLGSGVEGGLSQLLNNLALCNFYCGFYHRVMPLFLKSFLNSPNKLVTSDIWYNVSFVPLSCGYKNLTLACLRLALKNNSQNEEALNNLGCLKYGGLINDDLHFANRQELWGLSQQKPIPESELVNFSDSYQVVFDEAESHFDPLSMRNSNDSSATTSVSQPEMLYNMALVKKRRGHLLASVKYCTLYLEYDSNNCHIHDIIKEIKQIISHDI